MGRPSSSASQAGGRAVSPCRAPSRPPVRAPVAAEAAVVHREAQAVPDVLADQRAVHRGGEQPLGRALAGEFLDPRRRTASPAVRRRARAGARRRPAGARAGRRAGPGPAARPRRGSRRGRARARSRRTRPPPGRPVGWPWVCAAHSTASCITSCGSQPTSSPNGAERATAARPGVAGVLRRVQGAHLLVAEADAGRRVAGPRRAYSHSSRASQPSSLRRSSGPQSLWVAAQRR